MAIETAEYYLINSKLSLAQENLLKR